MYLIDTNLAHRKLIDQPGAGFTALLDAAEMKMSKITRPYDFDYPSHAHVVNPSLKVPYLGSRKGSPAVVIPSVSPTKGLGCELCQVETDLGEHLVEVLLCMTQKSYSMERRSWRSAIAMSALWRGTSLLHLTSRL